MLVRPPCHVVEAALIICQRFRVGAAINWCKQLMMAKAAS